MNAHRHVTENQCGCEAIPQLTGLISVKEAFRHIDRCATPVSGTETVQIGEALGRTLAASVLARSDMPRFDNSAMDGFALNTRDLVGSGPWTVDVFGAVAAGQAVGTLPRGKATRILTGAPVPRRANAVLAQETVTCMQGAIGVETRPAVGQHIRHAGEEFSCGAELLAPGIELSTRQIAACAAAGQGCVDVYRQPRIALLTTGDEVCAAETELHSGQIWDVNTPMLAAALTRVGGCALSIHKAADDPMHLADVFGELMKTSDLVVTTGGVSVGDADFVKPVFKSLGGEIVFSGVAMKPGKPVTFGRTSNALWLGLPGNPLSAFVTWTLFGARLQRILAGQKKVELRCRKIPLGAELTHRPGRCEFRLGRLRVCGITGQDMVFCDAATHSGQVGSLSSADGMVHIPREVGRMATGDLVDFIPF